MPISKKPLTELTALMEPEHARVVREVYRDYRQIFDTVPGSSTKHQVWPGGLLSHTEETMNIVAVLYEAFGLLRPLPFSLSEALLCAFLHDFDKVQRYKIVDGKLTKTGSYNSDYVTHTIELVGKRYHYRLSDEQINALRYVHGEGEDYHPTERVMLPLATIVHCGDITSARIWFNKGRVSTTW